MSPDNAPPTAHPPRSSPLHIPLGTALRTSLIAISPKAVWKPYRTPCAVYPVFVKNFSISRYSQGLQIIQLKRASPDIVLEDLRWASLRRFQETSWQRRCSRTLHICKSQTWTQRTVHWTACKPSPTSSLYFRVGSLEHPGASDNSLSSDR